MNRVMPSLLGLAVLLGVCAGCKTEKKQTELGPPAITVKAEQLLKDYVSNVVAAEAKYKDKVIQVTGKCGGVQKALAYVVVIYPEADSDELAQSAVQCFM